MAQLRMANACRVAQCEGRDFQNWVSGVRRDILIIEGTLTQEEIYRRNLDHLKRKANYKTAGKK